MISSVNYNKLFITIGIIGALIILYGQSQSYPQIYYIIGSFALLATAIYYKLVYFIALELILMAGHTAILIGVGRYNQIALPLLLCFQLLIFYLMVGKENSIFLLIGIVGIALLSLGLSFNHQWIFFSGSLGIALYAYHSGYKKQYPSYIWAILNTIFALLALNRIFINL